MSIQGWYYLHINGDLIYKKNFDAGVEADIRESDLAVAMWAFDPSQREDAWTILVEALAAGANRERIVELAAKWGCDDNDAHIYADRLKFKLFLDGDTWFAAREDFISLQESPAGHGASALEAIAMLAKELGYKPSKMWGNSFQQLLS